MDLWFEMVPDAVGLWYPVYMACIVLFHARTVYWVVFDVIGLVLPLVLLIISLVKKCKRKRRVMSTTQARFVSTIYERLYHMRMSSVIQIMDGWRGHVPLFEKTIMKRFTMDMLAVNKFDR